MAYISFHLFQLGNPNLRLKVILESYILDIYILPPQESPNVIEQKEGVNILYQSLIQTIFQCDRAFN